MIGQIQSAQKSKSLKTLSVMVDGNRYTSKNWEFEQMVGQRIIFDPSPQSMPDGGSITWINEYQLEGSSTTPATQAMDAAMGQQPYGTGTPPAGYTPPETASGPPQGHPANVVTKATHTPADRNKDAEIAANGLMHCMRPKDAQEAWDNFTWLYHKFNDWNPKDDVPYV